jgi:WhiB family redox-sensing transcriptional regulator
MGDGGATSEIGSRIGSGGSYMVITGIPGQRAGPDKHRDWWDAAACRTVDPDLFFPVSAAGPGGDEIARAKAMCAGCQVRRQCLHFALTTRQLHGVWGGLTEEERRLLA